jgi:hypothetical protein
MDSNDSIDSELQKNISNDFTPETLAWMLLVDENVEKKIDVGQLIAAIDLDNEPNPTVYNSEAYEFEILITIYMEMVFGWFKLLHLMEDEQKNLETEFKPNLSLVTLNDIIEPFTEKLTLIGYNLHVTEITNMDYYKLLQNKSYGRIALRDLKSDETFFRLNSKNIDPEKRYHFVMNGNYKGERLLRNIYMIFMLNDKGYKINFTHQL